MNSKQQTLSSTGGNLHGNAGSHHSSLNRMASHGNGYGTLGSGLIDQANSLQINRQSHSNSLSQQLNKMSYGNSSSSNTSGLNVGASSGNSDHHHHQNQHSQQNRVTSASNLKQNAGNNHFAHDQKNSSSSNTIGVRQSFTQKPPTDVRNGGLGYTGNPSTQQPQLFQKNFKYLENNRLNGSGSASSNLGTSNQQNTHHNSANIEEKQSKAGGNYGNISGNGSNTLLSAKREQLVYKSMNSGLQQQNTHNSNNAAANHHSQSNSQVRNSSQNAINRLLENTNQQQSNNMNSNNSISQQQTSINFGSNLIKPLPGRPSTSDNNLSLNLNGKSRNQSNGGYNGVQQQQMQLQQNNHHGDSMKEMQIGEKFSIGSIPRSTTNKTYSSLTNQIRDQGEQLAPSTSRGLSSTGISGNVPSSTQQQYFQRNHVSTASSSSQNFRAPSNGPTNSTGLSQQNTMRTSHDFKHSKTMNNHQQQQYSNVTSNSNTNTVPTPKNADGDKKTISSAAATFLSRHQRVEEAAKSRVTKTMSGLYQQKYNENINSINQQNQDKSQSRSNVRDTQLAKDIPNMKVSRPNTVGYKDINTSTKSATGLNTKSQTMAPQSLQQLIKDASGKSNAENNNQIKAQVNSQRNSQLTQIQQRHKSNSREGLTSASHSSGNLNTQQQSLTSGGIGSSRNVQNQAHKSQQNVMTKTNMKAFFEANANNMNMTQKIDPQTGAQTKVQSFTTLNINQMIHDADEDDETRKLPLQPGTRIVIPNHEPTKCSMKRNGIVRAYAANTNQGLVRNYNEDRVSIILNIVKPEHRQHEEWPKCSFFGVYDGHGGHACAEFLRDNLHHFVIKEDQFPWNPKEAILKGFQKAEDRFMEMCLAVDENGEPTLKERSGSCAIVSLIVGDVCYIANVGDSRAVLSAHGGQQVMALSQDHKPSEDFEYQRIIAAGGQVYQTTTSTQTTGASNGQEEQDPDYIVGPIRVLPGRLSVSRTFGDPEAKVEFRGGNPNVVACIPDVESFKITKDHDFIILGCDGIFDKLDNDDCASCVWNSCNIDNKDRKIAQNVHQQSGLAVESVLKNSLYRQSLDNVTVVMIAFQNFKRQVFGKSKHSERSAQKPTTKISQQNSSISSVQEFMTNNLESQKENINNNNNRIAKNSIGSFLSQRPQNDENVPPQSMMNQEKLISHQKGLSKPPSSAANANNLQGNKNMGHLLSTMNGNNGLVQRNENHGQSEALKEKTGMFINRTYNQPSLNSQYSNNTQAQIDQLNRQVGSRKPSISSNQVTNSLSNNENSNPLSFLGNQTGTPKGSSHLNSNSNQNIFGGNNNHLSNTGGQASANPVYRSLNGSLRNNLSSTGSSVGNGVSLNMRNNAANVL